MFVVHAGARMRPIPKPDLMLPRRVSGNVDVIVLALFGILSEVCSMRNSQSRPVPESVVKVISRLDFVDLIRPRSVIIRFCNAVNCA